MFGRKSDNEKRLDAAKVDLAAARAKLGAIDAKESDALANGTAFAAWSEERKTAATEVDRLARLIAVLVAGGDAARRHDADEAFRKRVDAARKNNAAVAERLRTDGAKLSAELTALARDVARSQVETNAINRILPGGTPPLQDANSLARGRAAIPREDVSEKTLNLWVRATDGSLMGDQDRVVEVDAKSGHLFVNNMRVDYVRRRFKSVQYHPAEWSEIPEPFHATLRIPNFDRQGIDFDGSRLTEEALAELNLDPPKTEKKARRTVQTELIPLEPWTPPVSKPLGSSDEAA
jgi:hypothetical protein